jgi:hypothetical protein
MNGAFDLRLVRMRLAGYGRLQDYTLEPSRSPGVLIVAPNEAGKSTVASALFHGLFGFTDKALEDLRRPWGGGPFRVTMEWACGDDLRCTIDRDFDSRAVTVEWRRMVPGAREPVLVRRWEGEPNPRGRSSDRALYDQELRRLLGFASGDVFRQTAYVGPGDTGVHPLADELLRLLSGSERADFRSALVEFEAGYYDLTQKDIGGNGRNAKHKPRRIEERSAERAELVRRRDEALAAREGRRGAEEAIRACHERIVRIEHELVDRGHAEQAFLRLGVLRREIAEADKRRAELDQAIGGFVDWERRVREKAAQLEPLVRYLRVPRDFPDRIRRARALAEDRARLAARANELRDTLDREPGALREAVAASFGILLMAAAAVLAFLVPPESLRIQPIPTAIGGAAAGVLLLGWALWLRLRRRGRRQQLMVSWAGIEAEALDVEQEQRVAAQPLTTLFDPEDADAEIDRYDRAQVLKMELDALQEARKALGDREALERERRIVKEERLDVLRLEQRKLVETHSYLDWGPDYERQFVVDQGRLQDERERLQNEELTHRRTLADLKGGEEDPLRLDAQIAELDSETERLALDRDAFRLAYHTLTACKDEFLRVMTQRLQTRIGRVFGDMTGGRYDAVEIDPASLELTVHGIEKRDVPAESLSRGTRDQLYFALRVAILEELAADRALPIVLDDPFLHFDRDRLALVEETLARLGETHQILVLTHDARLAGWSFPKQFLPAPVTREEQVPASGG